MLSNHQIKTIKRLTKADQYHAFNGQIMSSHIFINSSNGFKLLLEIDKSDGKAKFYTSYNSEYYGDGHDSMRSIYSEIKDETLSHSSI